MRLNDPLMDTFEYKGHTFQLELAYDVVLDVIELLEDNSFTTPQKVTTALYLLLGQDLDYPLKEQAEILSTIATQFIGGQEEEQENLDILGNPMPVAPKARAYDIRVDGDLIFASFYQAYGVDLIEEQGKLRWEKFLALLKGLPRETSFMQVVDIRTRELPTGKGTEKERSKLLELKRRYALPERG